MTFDVDTGIDYAERETPTSRTPTLQAYAAFDNPRAARIFSPASTDKTYKNWHRRGIAEWLIDQAQKHITFIAGIERGFSCLLSYYERYNFSFVLFFRRNPESKESGIDGFTFHDRIRTSFTPPSP